jgi:bifunctional non-homologous end joining protein LigD
LRRRGGGRQRGRINSGGSGWRIVRIVVKRVTADYLAFMLTDGNEMFAASCKLGFEGIISKNAEAPYRSERNEGWLKVKCVQKGKFPVIGFVKDATGVAALYLGKKEGKELALHKKGRHRLVPHGIEPDSEAARHLRHPKWKRTKPIRKPKAVWVEPSFFAEVEYRDITSEGLLRQSSFKGLKRS